MRILFEFGDLKFLPDILHKIILEILHIAEKMPYGTYLKIITDKIIEISERFDQVSIIELGAGNAPVTEELLQRSEAKGFIFIPCDLRPNVERFKSLSQTYASQVKPLFEAINYSTIDPVADNALYICSGTFHHLHANEKDEFIKRIHKMERPTIIAEPLRHNLPSLLRAILGVIPALSFPLICLGKKQFFPALLWCWIIPIAPIIFVWDGLISAIRIWTETRWQNELQKFEIARKDYRIESTNLYQFILIYCHPD